MAEDLFGTTKDLSRMDKLRASRKVTNDFQRWVLDYLNSTGDFKVWRNNNIPSTRHQVIKEVIKAFDANGNPIEIVTEHVKVNFKKNQKTVSTFDIIGFRIKDGLHLEIEIKTGKDQLDHEQKLHMNDLQASGCISFATGNKQMFLVQIKPYIEEKPLPF
jgi:hypothetical protein